MLVDELSRAGVRHAVIAPGSRSTPLTLAFAEHPDIEDHSVIDERSAAFFALGLAMATAQAVVVVTTSGTATANLYPAVFEADEAGVPLVLLTADRPARLRNTGDSQAADQIKMFGERVRLFHEVDRAEASERALGYLRSTADAAVAQALGTSGRPGPVHLNLPLEKPLDPTPAADDEPGAIASHFDLSTSPSVHGRSHGGTWSEHVAGQMIIGADDLEHLAIDVASARRPLILIGAGLLSSRAWRRPLGRLLEHVAIPVWAECMSQVRLDPDRSESILPSADLLLGSEEFRRRLDEHPPDLVLRLGEAPIGWPLRRFVSALAERPETRLIGIAADGRRRDPEHGLSTLIAVAPDSVLDALAKRLSRRHSVPLPIRMEAGWSELHRRLSRSATEAVADLMETSDDGELWDGRTVYELGRTLPEDAALFVSSSLPLRDLESFLLTTEHDVDLFANRGLNGIDGVTSTALGVAHARRVTGVGSGSSEDPSSGQGTSRTVLVIGDVALAHDLSGLAMASRLRSDLTIVVIDNGGGAIFDFLPLAKTAESPTFERHFTTPPGHDLGALCRALGIDHVAPESWSQFRRAMTESIDAPGTRIVQLRTDRARSKARRTEVLEQIATQVDAAVAQSTPHSTNSMPETSLAAETLESTNAPIVLLHGFTGSAASWNEFRRCLDQALRDRDADRPIVALDLPGHGRHPEPADLGLPELSTWVIDELDRRGISRCHLLGYSMGGRVALATALGASERIESLTLISAGAGIDDEDQRTARHQNDQALAERIEADGLARFVDNWMNAPRFASQSRLGHRGLRAQRTERLKRSSASLAASLRNAGQGSQPSYWQALVDLDRPCLLIAGAEDETYVEITHRLEQRLPKAQHQVIAKSGHAPQIEQSRATADLICEFVTTGSIGRVD